jgi:hypothetical protein
VSTQAIVQIFFASSLSITANLVGPTTLQRHMYGLVLLRDTPTTIP